MLKTYSSKFTTIKYESLDWILLGYKCDGSDLQLLNINKYVEKWSQKCLLVQVADIIVHKP